MVKIYIPKNDEIKNLIVKEVSGKEEFNYICNKNEYDFLREISQEEFDSLGVQSKEHEIGNVLVYETGATYILDGLGYFKINFEELEKKEWR